MLIIKKPYLTSLLLYGITISGFSSNNPLAEELNINDSSRNQKSLSKNITQQFLPNEILLKIFNANLAALPAINRVNKEWHRWAKPQIKTYRVLCESLYKSTSIAFKKSMQAKEAIAEDKKYNQVIENGFCELVFNKLSSKNNAHIAYPAIRNKIIAQIDHFDFKNSEVYKDNQQEFTLEDGQPKDQLFNIHTLIKNWGLWQKSHDELNLADSFWRISKILKELPDDADTLYFKYDRLNELHNSKHYTLMPKMIEQTLRYRNAYVNDSKKAMDIAYALVEIDKLYLILAQETDNVFSNYYSTAVMKFYQNTPVDLEKNTGEIRLQKINQSQRDILNFIKGAVENIGIYKTLIQHHLKLG